MTCAPPMRGFWRNRAGARAWTRLRRGRGLCERSAGDSWGIGASIVVDGDRYRGACDHGEVGGSCSGGWCRDRKESAHNGSAFWAPQFSAAGGDAGLEAGGPFGLRLPDPGGMRPSLRPSRLQLAPQLDQIAEHPELGDPAVLAPKKRRRLWRARRSGVAGVGGPAAESARRRDALSLRSRAMPAGGWRSKPSPRCCSVSDARCRCEHRRSLP